MKTTRSIKWFRLDPLSISFLLSLLFLFYAIIRLIEANSYQLFIDGVGLAILASSISISLFISIRRIRLKESSYVYLNLD